MIKRYMALQISQKRRLNCIAASFSGYSEFSSAEPSVPDWFRRRLGGLGGWWMSERTGYESGKYVFINISKAGRVLSNGGENLITDWREREARYRRNWGATWDTIMHSKDCRWEGELRWEISSQNFVRTSAKRSDPPLIDRGRTAAAYLQNLKYC